jgi:tRNA nucleotidyltransferase/poly(A) polymerase
MDVLKNEGPETIHAAKLLLKLGLGRNLKNKEMEFLKAQSADVGKMLALFGLFMIPGGLLIVPIVVKGLKKLGINPYPSDQSHLREKKEMLRQQIRKILAEQMLGESEIRIPFELEIPQDIWDLKKFFDANGKELYVVGGAVRDVLTDNQIKDYDLATDATPDEMMAFIPQATKEEVEVNGGVPSFGKYLTIEAGNIFPVIHLVTSERGRYEIATFRIDVGTDHRKPETQFATIAQDVKRRDLTMNALFYDLNTKEIVDLVGGVDDIMNGRVRTVGDPTQRFAENQIRKLRAIRFTARIGSVLDQSISDSLRANPSLDEEAQEAVTEEFLKGLSQAKSVSHYLKMMFEFGFQDWIFKGLPVDANFIIEEKDISLLIASLARNAKGGDIRQHMKLKLKYPDTIAKRIMFFVRFQNFKVEGVKLFWKLNQAISQVSEVDLLRAADIFGYDKRMVKAFSQFEPIANADELMAQGLKGRELGDEMNRIDVEHFKSLV